MKINKNLKTLSKYIDMPHYLVNDNTLFIVILRNSMF